MQVTTGTPIALLIENTDQRSKDYSDIKDKFRPGHADFTYEAKYGLRDYRGGGRSSARETATRVAAGAIARKIVPEMTVRGALVQMGPHKIDREKWDWDEIARNPFFCPDKDKAAFFEGYLDDIRKKGSSIGAVIEVVAGGVPAGLGAPIYAKLDADLAAALMSINAVKGVEIGAGFGAAELSGEENADEMRMGNQGVSFLSNHAGGILGGISTGQPVVARFAVKPTSSILSPRRTVDRSGADTDIMTKGRHDPCVGIYRLADRWRQVRAQPVQDDGGHVRTRGAGRLAAVARRRLRPDSASRYFRPQFHLAAGSRSRRRHCGF